MVAPGLIALITPVVIGFIFGPEVLGGMLAGVTVSGVLMGMFQSNAGGAWDNAKKSFEKGAVINGQTYYKKSEPHKAAVTGDTVGDPFKDTSGPSMNILIKLMSIVSLVIAPYIAGRGFTMDVNNGGMTEMNMSPGMMGHCEEGKDCKYMLDTTYTDAEGHTIVEKKCIMMKKGEGMDCCMDKMKGEKGEKKDCCMDKKDKKE
jgi:hypothetical protein